MAAPANALRLDPEQAEVDARTPYKKPKGAAPHWLRCEWYAGTHRCKLGDGHPGVHDFEKESTP